MFNKVSQSQLLLSSPRWCPSAGHTGRGEAGGCFYQDGSHLRPHLLPPSGQHHGPDGADGLQGQRLQLSRPVRDPRLQLQRDLWQGHQEGEFTPLHLLRAEVEESPRLM